MFLLFIFARVDANSYNECKDYTKNVLKCLRQCETMNCNAIWEKCISVCITCRKKIQCDSNTSTKLPYKKNVECKERCYISISVVTKVNRSK